MLRVNFNGYGSYTTDSVYQWDLNHTLLLQGLTLDRAPTIQFCNKKSTSAIVVQSKKVTSGISCSVPNQLLEEPYPIVAYIHVYDSNNAKTIETITIPLIRRAKPDDYEFTGNADIKNFERLEADIADFIKKITKDFAQLSSDTDSTLEDYKVEMDTTLQSCRDAISALALEIVNVDGGTPTTSDYSEDDTYNGGYPVGNS